MKKNLLLVAILAGIVFLPETVSAQDYYGPIDQVGGALQDATAAILKQITEVAFKLLFSLSLVKFILQGITLAKAGDIEMSIGKWASSFLWIGFVVWLMSPAASPVRDGLPNGADFIQRGVDWALGYASTMSGGNGTSFSAADIFNIGLNASHNLITAVGASMTGSVVAVVKTFTMPQVTILTALMLVVTNTAILVSCGYIAVKVFMVKLDAAVVIALSPLSFALSGLDALREQGMAPFKNLITIIYRIFILAAIVSAMKVVSDSLSTVLTNATNGGTEVWAPIWAAIFGYFILLYMAHKSDGIAAGLSSGSSMFSSGDMASSIATGVAAGMAVATGGAAMAGAAAKGGQSMGDFIKELTTKGEVSNASPVGNGEKQPIGTPPTKPKKAGSGEKAGIGGNPMDQKLDKVLESLNQPKKAGFGERMSALNDHVAKEQSTVQAHINVNAHDN